MSHSGTASRWTDHDPYITPEARQAAQHLCLADTPELTTQQPRQLGLRHADDFRGRDLREPAPLDDLTNLGGKLRLDQHLVRIRPAEIGIDVRAAFLDLCHAVAPFAWASAAFSRRAIRSSYGFGVAMPLLAFF